jgi:hypothetical protein
MTSPAPADVSLYDRLVDLLGKHDVHPVDRAAIQDAFQNATTWDDLPQEVRDRIEELEKNLPSQSWEDPSDVPSYLAEFS